MTISALGRVNRARHLAWEVRRTIEAVEVVARLDGRIIRAQDNANAEVDETERKAVIRTHSIAFKGEELTARLEDRQTKGVENIKNRRQP